MTINLWQSSYDMSFISHSLPFFYKKTRFIVLLPLLQTHQLICLYPNMRYFVVGILFIFDHFRFVGDIPATDEEKLSIGVGSSVEFMPWPWRNSAVFPSVWWLLHCSNRQRNKEFIAVITSNYIFFVFAWNRTFFHQVWIIEIKYGR